MEEMQIFQKRLDSFGRRGCNWPHKHFKATALRLAQVGFYYDSKDIYNDNVTCYLCNCSYHGWKKDDIPMEIHQKTSPQCPLVIILSYSKEWVRKPNEDKTYTPGSSSVCKARLATFKNWWPHTYPNITAERIAEAGLYYSPDIDSEDRVECAYCKAKFNYWTSSDNPRSKHFRFKEKCPFFKDPDLKKKRKAKKIENNINNNKNKNQLKSFEDDSDFTDNSMNQTNKKKKGKEKEDDEMDVEEDKEENEIEFKKTYNTRYAKREIKKVNYNEDLEDELFSFEDEDEDEEEEEEEGEGEGEDEDEDEDEYKDEDEDENEDNEEQFEEGKNEGKEENENESENENENAKENNDENINEIQEVSIIIDDKEPSLMNTESSDEEKLSKKVTRKNINNDNESENNVLNEKELNKALDIDNAITEEYEPKISIDKTNNKKSEKSVEKTKEKNTKMYHRKDDDEYIKSDSNNDFSDDSSSYEGMSRKKSKRPKKYKKKRNVYIDDSLYVEDTDTEEEELINKEIKKLLSTEHGYLGPLPKIKSKVVIEEEKKLFEEMKKRAEENLSSDLDIETTNPEYVSVTKLLRKRKKESNYNEFNISPKRISLDSSQQEVLSSNSNSENKSNNIDNMNHETIQDLKIKTPITIQKIKEAKNFTIVKVLNTVDNSSSKKPINLLESISKEKIESILKNTPIKLIEKNQSYIKNTPLNISEEDLNANNLFMIDDEANLDLLKEKIIEILMENSKIENINEVKENNNDNNNNNKDTNKADNDFMDIDENQINSSDDDIVEIINENEDNDESRRISQIKNEISQLKISPSKQLEEHEEELKDEETTDTKKKELYEIKSSEKKILKELSFSITTPEPNLPNLKTVSGKTDDKTFKTPLSSQVNNFHLSSDISLDETVDALLSTPTPLPLGLSSNSYLKNDKELLIRTIMEENKKSLKKLNKQSQLLSKQDTTNKSEAFYSISNNVESNKNNSINDTAKSNRSITSPYGNDENKSFMSYEDSYLSFMDDSVIRRSKQKTDDNIEKIVNTIQKLKETIDTVNDVSVLVLDKYKQKKESSPNNSSIINNILTGKNLEIDIIKESENKSDDKNKKENIISLSESLNDSVNEEEILENYFNFLISTPNNVNAKSKDKNENNNNKSLKKVIEVEDDILSMTVGQYLEKVNKDIAEKLKMKGEEKIYQYYQQLFGIEDLYLQYLNKMVNQLQEYPKDKKILESQTKLMKNTLINDRKNIKMKIKTSTDDSNAITTTITNNKK